MTTAVFESRDGSHWERAAKPSGYWASPGTRFASAVAGVLLAPLALLVILGVAALMPFLRMLDSRRGR